MGCKHSKVVNSVQRRSHSPLASPKSVKSRESVGQTSPHPPVRVVQVQPCSRPNSPVPPRLARSVSNTTFVVNRGSHSGQTCASNSSGEDFLVDGGRDTVNIVTGGSDESGEPSPIIDGRITRTIIRQVEDYRRFDYINSDDISDVVEIYNYSSDDSDEDIEESFTNLSSSGSDSDPMLARRTRTPEMVRKIRAFEKDVSSLMVAQSIPGCSTTDASVRPKAAKGVRVAGEKDLGEQNKDLSDRSSLVACPERSRPQLTVAGLKTTGDDCLNSWMRRQQHMDESEGKEDVEEAGVG